jgi:hypothetical protein
MARYVVKFTLNGTPKTGLTPVVTAYFKLSDLADVAVPTIAEAKAGVYILTASPTEYMVVCIDGSATLTSASERYKTILIGPNDYFADASISSRGTGDATAASQTTIINALTAIASAIGAIPAAVWTYLSDQGNRVVTNLIAFFQNAGAVTSNKVDNVTVIQEQQAGARTVTITVKNADGDPIPDAEIQLLTTGGVPAGSRGRTNALGQVAASVDDGNYIITGHKYFVTFTNAAITVDAAHLAFDYTGAEWSPSEPSGNDIQTVWDYARLGTGAAQPGASITATVINAANISDSIILKNKVSDQASSVGYWELPLIKGVTYQITVSYAGVTTQSKNITVTSDGDKQLSTY